ncbi:MAG: single-stranded DNA-binding protein [Methanobrevibacter sp.]|nr:single-stranded DNA-binding protein [Methanobrevibacter sp.]
MTDVNHVILIGRLTRDLGDDERSFGFVANGTARANVSIAVNRSVKKGEEWVDEVNYFDVTIWGKTAENLKPYLTKGKQIAIDGYLKQDRWEKDGQKMSKITVVSNNVQLLGGKGENNNSAAPGSYSQSENVNNQGAAPSNDGGFPEDIPF